jgi:hypothetical protein
MDNEAGVVEHCHRFVRSIDYIDLFLGLIDAEIDPTGGYGAVKIGKVIEIIKLCFGRTVAQRHRQQNKAANESRKDGK